MSFMVQARTTYHQKLTEQRFTTRTYDMITGQRVFLTDVFDEAEDTWSFLADRVREGLTAYWPEEEPEQKAIEIVIRVTGADAEVVVERGAE